MNQKITFKKDCILKTYIEEITDIEVNPEYKVLDDIIDGIFVINGSYKINRSSKEEETFNNKLPFQIALSEEIKKESIDLNISDFNYIANKDILHLDIELDLSYEKNKKEDEIVNAIESITNEYEGNNKEDKEIPKESKGLEKDEEYTKYKVYIFRKEDTIESVAIKYNVSLEILKEYNNLEEIEENSKIIIPIIDEDN